MKIYLVTDKKVTFETKSGDDFTNTITCVVATADFE